MHRDISIFNMAFYREDIIIGVLIDFDLATYPEEAALLFIESTDMSPSTNVTSDRSTDTNPAPINITQGRTVVFNGGQKLINGQDRSGTTPFMAIETLDVGNPTYRHHLCHELESLFYGTVWHSVGYRYKKRVFPKPPAPKGEKNKKIDDYLRDWRVGTWKETLDAKASFLNDPELITSKIADDDLNLICLILARLFRKRRDAARSALDRLKEEAQEMQLKARREGVTQKLVTPEYPPMTYENAIYTRYAEIWGIKAGKCEKDCCVSRLASRN